MPVVLREKKAAVSRTVVAGIGTARSSELRRSKTE